MKTFSNVLFFALLFTNLSVFAGEPIMVTLQPTEIQFSVQNLSAEKIENMNIHPRLACQTIQPEGGGESITDINTADLKYATAQLGSATSSQFNLKITAPAEVSAPKKESLGSKSSCYTGVNMSLEINGSPDYFIPILGFVQSNKNKADLTDRFKKSLTGQYYMKLVQGGIEYNPELGERIPYCAMGLFKRVSNQDKYLGYLMQYTKSNCDLSNLSY